MATKAVGSERPHAESEIGDPSAALDRMEQALPSAVQGAVEFVLVRQRLGLTRFARGRVHQNVEDETARLVARVWSNGGRGIAASEPADLGDIASVREIAELGARYTSVPTPSLPVSMRYEDLETWFDATAGADAVRRAAIAKDALGRAEGLELSGHLRIATQDITIVNSAGLRAYAPLTFASFVVSAVSDGAVTGSASAISRDLDSLQVAQAVDEAVRVAFAARRPLPVPEGEVRVLLDPPAVSMLLLNLGIIGLNSFSALGEASGSSFVARHFGETVASEAITLSDDGIAEEGLPVPFDLEGTPKRPLTIIERGIARAVAHDLESASRAGAVTTGHALLAGEKSSTPTALRIDPGSTPRDELVRGLERGLIIRRIHPFVSLRGGPEAQISGTTRDGVFVVEAGEIVRSATNVRWSCSATDLLRSVEGVSSEHSVEFMDLPAFFPSTNHVPSLLCGRLRVHGSQPRE